MTSRGSGGVLTISGTLNKPGTVTVSGTAYITGSGNSFSAIAPVVTGSNNIQISATNANGYGVTKTLSVNVTGGTAIPSLTYDANGNLTYDGTWNYSWDAANRLVKIWYGPVGSSASTTMSYDGLGRRVGIIETGSSGSVTSTKHLVWEGMAVSEEKSSSGTLTKRYFSQGVQISGSNDYYTRDHLGSIREMTTGTSGLVVARYAYDPYGTQTQLSGTMTADFGFTGDYYHSPSGLCLTLHREYSSGFGRWLSRDPKEDVEKIEGPNLYEYVLNNPFSHTDPDGRGKWGVIYDPLPRSKEHPKPGFQITYTLDATEKSCCLEATITQERENLWGVYRPDDSGLGYYKDGVAYSSADAPSFGIGNYEFSHTYYFRWTVTCTKSKGSCLNKIFSTTEGTWKTTGGWVANETGALTFN